MTDEERGLPENTGCDVEGDGQSRGVPARGEHEGASYSPLGNPGRPRRPPRVRSSPFKLPPRSHSSRRKRQAPHSRLPRPRRLRNRASRRSGR